MESKYKRFRKNLMSRKILSLILDDFSFFGSMPFYLLITLVTFFLKYDELFHRLVYTFLISFIVVLTIKAVHYKDRPQKEEFSIFIEKMVAASFPSTHSLSVTVLVILLNLAFHAWWLKVLSLIIAFLVYMQRYITKKHYVIDIIGGIIIAIIEVIFVVRVL